MATILEYIQGVYPLPENVSADLRRVIKIKDVPKMDIWFPYDDISNGYAFLEKGLFRRFYVLFDEEFCTGIFKESDWFTTSAFFNRNASIENVQALEPSRVQYITFEDYHTLCHQHPIINKALRLQMKKFVRDWFFGTNSDRVKPYRKYKRLFHAIPNLLTRVNSSDLCSYLKIDENTLQEFKYGNNKVL